MAITDKEITIRLRTIAEMQDAKAAAAALRDLADEMISAGDAMAANTAPAAAMAEQTRNVAEGGKKAAEGMDDVGKKAPRMGAGVLEASRAFEDLQYGIRGVLNNIPTMVMSFGGGAGLAAAMSFVAVAGDVLYRNLSGVTEKSKEAKAATDALAEATEKLSKKMLESGAENARRSMVAYARELESQERALDARTRATEKAIAADKRFAQLQDELAAAERKRREAEITWREKNDPNYKATDAVRDRAAIRGEDGQADVNKRIDAEQARVDAAFAVQKEAEARAKLAEDQLADMRQRLDDAETRKKTAEQELQRYKQLAASAESMDAKAKENKDAAAGLRWTMGQTGASHAEIAEELRPLLEEASKAKAKADQIRQDMTGINLPQLEKQLAESQTKAASLKRSIESAETKSGEAQADLEEAKATVQTIAEQSQKNVDAIYDIADTVANTRKFEDMGKIVEAVKSDLTGAISKVETAATTAAGDTGAVSEKMRTALGTFTKALEDGVIDNKEVEQLRQAIQKMKSSAEAVVPEVRAGMQQMDNALRQLMDLYRQQQQQLQQLAGGGG